LRIFSLSLLYAHPARIRGAGEEVRLGIAPGMKGMAEDESEDEVDAG
jgi:hypothetical protein